MENYEVIVVGGGPAGLLAAGSAAETGKKVLVLEKMRHAGRKLLITGKGRCNITNNAEIAEFITHVYPNGRFLRNAFSQFYSADIIDLLKKYHVESTLERGGRYFPASNKSADVLKALLAWCNDLKVTIETNANVEELLIEEHKIIGLISNGKTLKAPKVILATGGMSYPATGSTGDGYKLSKQAGHKVIPHRPALVSMKTEGDTAQKLQGLNLKNVRAVIWIDGKKVAEDFGEMIFTHFGLSGPIILTLSRIAVDALKKKQRVTLTVDLKPALDEEKLDKRLVRDLNEHGKKKLYNIFRNWLPSSMIPVFLDLLRLDSEKECHQVSAKERKRIKHLLKNLEFNVVGHGNYNEAIITAGGISTKEIFPKTMESKKCKGLFFAGELIDLDAETGGYNLQIAYSTGWLAGRS